MHDQESSSSGEVEALLADASLPQPIRAALRSGVTLERIELDAEGQWRHQGALFEHPFLIELFHRSIVRTSGGTYLVEIPPYAYPITVMDTPRYVRHIRIDPSAQPCQIRLYLSDGSEQPLCPSSLSYVPDRGLYCHVQTSKGERLAARFLRPAYYALSEHIIDDQDAYFLQISDGKWPIPIVTHAQARLTETR